MRAVLPTNSKDRYMIPSFRLIIVQYMPSTNIYQSIREQLAKKQKLVGALPQLASFAVPGGKLLVRNMNPQQILAQVYASMSKTMEQYKQQKEELVAGMKEEGEEEDGEQEQAEDVQGQGDDEGLMEDQGNEHIDNDFDQEMEGAAEQEEMPGILQAQDQQGQQEQDPLYDEQMYEGEEDVGLYGEQLDQQSMEDYQNQGISEDEREFEQEERKIKQKRQQIEQEQVDDEGQKVVQDAFDHFRQLQMKNLQETKVEQKNELTKQIQKLQTKIIQRKDWVLRGQVKANQRPVNSLLEYDLQFNTGIKLSQEVTAEYNQDLEKVLKQRILDELFDDRVRYTALPTIRQHFASLRDVSTEKSKQGLAELYELEFKNYLGLAENKNDKLKTDILGGFKEINYYLDSLSNFSFTPKPNINGKSTHKEASIVQEKTPIAVMGVHEQTDPLKRRFQSQKEEDKKGKRIKNKRISRQRVKEQMRKKMNKKIEYGGMTKFQAKVVSKIAKNAKASASPNIKYNKSANFFKQINQNQANKPNANLGKARI